MAPQYLYFHNCWHLLSGLILEVNRGRLYSHISNIEEQNQHCSAVFSPCSTIYLLLKLHYGLSTRKLPEVSKAEEEVNNAGRWEKHFFVVTTELLCKGLPSWHRGLKQSSNHLVKDRWKITTVSLLLAWKIIFLAQIWQNTGCLYSKGRKWWNVTSEIYCRHFCHSPYKSLCHITYACPSKKKKTHKPETKPKPPSRLSLYYWVWGKKLPEYRKPESEQVYVYVCVFLAGFSKCLGTHFHEDKWTVARGWRRENKIKSRKSRNVARIPWLGLIAGNLKVSGKTLGCISQPTFPFSGHSAARYRRADW